MSQTCSQCRHWHQVEQGPGPRGPVLLSGQQKPAAVGECRIRLLTLMRPDGMCISLYPQTAGEFPACGEFAGAADFELNHNGQRVGLG